MDGCFNVVDQFVDLLGLKSKKETRVTQSIMGTVVRVGLSGTFVSYGGTFKGYGSTPNTRNAVVEVTVSPTDDPDKRMEWDKSKYVGGLAYIYGGTFEAYTGANVFNFVRKKDAAQIAAQSVRDKYGNVSTQTVELSKEETNGLEIFFYENQDAVKAGANVTPIPISTANVQVRGGLFRCFYDALNVAIREDGDDQNFRVFPGTMGSVNLGADSFNTQLIQDGRIQINDVYGDGALVLMDCREDEENEDEGLYHYRLFCGDTELRYKSYLDVYPNNDPAINASRSMQLTAYDDNKKTSQVYTTDEEGNNIRAPYRETEYYFDCVIDNQVLQHYSIKPNFYNPNNSSMMDWQGVNLSGSEIWYYPTPMSHKQEKIDQNAILPVPVPDIAIGNTYLDLGTWHITQSELVSDDDWALAANTLHADEALLKSSSSIRTDMKYYTYKVYRVDPLTRDNIPENGIYNADSPLFTVRYGTCDDSLKCVMSLTELENRIGMAKGYASGTWHFSAGEMYRVTLEVEEHVGIGYGMADREYYSPTYNTFADKLKPAKVTSSVLFRCCSQKDNKDTDYNLNDEKDFSPLRITNAKLGTEKDAQGYDKNFYTIAPGTY
ncbi:MAG: hypothetical protein IK130_11545, partial [Oscillospiraceae bacterium]|nr:hypothetical protein [Oscillospiraceae bacterium]